MKVALTLLMLAAVTLSGCSESDPAPADEDDFQDFDDDLEATSSTGIIRGVIVDAAITPIADATVTIKSLGLSTTSSDQGLFGFADLEPGTYFLEATKAAHTKVQASVPVEAGVAKPDIVRMQIEKIPGLEPMVEPLKFNGYLTCGAAVFATSVGCTTFPIVASQIGDQSVFYHAFDSEPQHVQAELVWESTQAAAGMFIWEITPGGNTHIGYRETSYSPALAYLDNATIEANRDGIMDDGGIALRFFGGPHELCTGIYGFGCGVTIDQSATVYMHNCYNLDVLEGWRYTSDGDPVPPQ